MSGIPIGEILALTMFAATIFVVLIGYLLWTWWQRRSQPALASGPALRDDHSGNSRAPLGFGGGSGAAPAAWVPSMRGSRSDTPSRWYSV